MRVKGDNTAVTSVERFLYGSIIPCLVSHVKLNFRDKSSQVVTHAGEYYPNEQPGQSGTKVQVAGCDRLNTLSVKHLSLAFGSMDLVARRTRDANPGQLSSKDVDDFEHECGDERDQ